jgi:hypothetical protein
MKLYILKQIEDWDYSELMSIVVWALNASKARKIAASVCGSEGTYVWLSPKHSTCRQLKSDGMEGAVICNYTSD